MRTEQGVVHLTGAVRTEGVKRAAEKAAGGVGAVWEVESVLLAESAVAMAAANALARDPRTSRVLIDVACVGGSVTLGGQVRTTAENAAAVEVASAVPGVAAVIDELEIRSDAARKRWPEVAAEITSGSCHHAVSPCARLCTASRSVIASWTL